MTDDVERMLVRGGWSSAEPMAAVYDPLSDPPGARALAGRLAEMARTVEPDVVVAWEDVGDAVLAFLVAEHLGLPAVRAVDADGLVEIGRVHEGAAAILVGAAFPMAAPVLAVAAALEQLAGRLVGVVSLVDVGPEPLPVPHQSLHVVPREPDGG